MLMAVILIRLRNSLSEFLINSLRVCVLMTHEAEKIITFSKNDKIMLILEREKVSQKFFIDKNFPFFCLFIGTHKDARQYFLVLNKRIWRLINGWDMFSSIFIKCLLSLFCYILSLHSRRWQFNIWWNFSLSNVLNKYLIKDIKRTVLLQNSTRFRRRHILRAIF